MLRHFLDGTEFYDAAIRYKGCLEIRSRWGRWVGNSIFQSGVLMIFPFGCTAVLLLVDRARHSELLNCKNQFALSNYTRFVMVAIRGGRARRESCFTQVIKAIFCLIKARASKDCGNKMQQ